MSSIDLYSSENPEGHGLDGVGSFIRTLFPTVRVTVRPCALRTDDPGKIDAFAEGLASSRVKDPDKAEQDFEPMFGEVEYERRALLGKAKAGGVVYDGRKLQDIVRRSIGGSIPVDRAALVFTDRLVSTYSRDDLRHHLRTVVCGFPSVISVPGIVEAPARPKEYWIVRRRLEAEGAGELALTELNRSFKGKFVEHEDPRIPEILKGLSVQAVMFHLTLEPFCTDSSCRLFNAHWQADLVKSQSPKSGFCSRHSVLMRKLGEKPVLDW